MTSGAAFSGDLVAQLDSPSQALAGVVVDVVGGGRKIAAVDLGAVAPVGTVYSERSGQGNKCRKRIVQVVQG